MTAVEAMTKLVSLLKEIEEDVVIKKMDYLPSDHDKRISDIEGLLIDQLITEKGTSDIGKIIVLEDCGFKHRVLEQDSFGPLVCGIVTKKGIIRYG